MNRLIDVRLTVLLLASVVLLGSCKAKTNDASLQAIASSDGKWRGLIPLRLGFDKENWQGDAYFGTRIIRVYAPVVCEKDISEVEGLEKIVSENSNVIYRRGSRLVDAGGKPLAGAGSCSVEGKYVLHPEVFNAVFANSPLSETQYAAQSWIWSAARGAYDQKNPDFSAPFKEFLYEGLGFKALGASDAAAFALWDSRYNPCAPRVAANDAFAKFNPEKYLACLNGNYQERALSQHNLVLDLIARLSVQLMTRQMKVLPSPEAIAIQDAILVQTSTADSPGSVELSLVNGANAQPRLTAFSPYKQDVVAAPFIQPLISQGNGFYAQVPSNVTGSADGAIGFKQVALQNGSSQIAYTPGTASTTYPGWSQEKLQPQNQAAGVSTSYWGVPGKTTGGLINTANISEYDAKAGTTKWYSVNDDGSKGSLLQTVNANGDYQGEMRWNATLAGGKGQWEKNPNDPNSWSKSVSGSQTQAAQTGEALGSGPAISSGVGGVVGKDSGDRLLSDADTKSTVVKAANGEDPNFADTDAGIAAFRKEQSKSDEDPNFSDTKNGIDAYKQLQNQKDPFDKTAGGILNDPDAVTTKTDSQTDPRADPEDKTAGGTLNNPDAKAETQVSQVDPEKDIPQEGNPGE